MHLMVEQLYNHSVVSRGLRTLSKLGSMIAKFIFFIFKILQQLIICPHMITWIPHFKLQASYYKIQVKQVVNIEGGLLR